MTYLFYNGGAVCTPVMDTFLSDGLRKRVPDNAERANIQVIGVLDAVVLDRTPAHTHFHVVLSH